MKEKLSAIIIMLANTLLHPVFLTITYISPKTKVPPNVTIPAEVYVKVSARS